MTKFDKILKEQAKTTKIAVANLKAFINGYQKYILELEAKVSKLTFKIDNYFKDDANDTAERDSLFRYSVNYFEDYYDFVKSLEKRNKELEDAKAFYNDLFTAIEE